MNIVLAGNFWPGKEAEFSRQLDFEHRIDHWMPADGLESLGVLLSDASALVYSPDVAQQRQVLPLLRQATALRLVQLPFAGYDWFPREALPPGCKLCNSHEHSSAIAEFVLAGMLEMAIGLADINRSFRAGSWEYGGGQVLGRKHGELRDKRLGIFGFGHIGQEVAARARAFGMSCCAVGSRPRPQPPAPLDWYGGPESFERLLAESDYLLLSAPISEHTRGKFDAAALAKMKPQAVLINVARAPMVDPEALHAALEHKRLRGAILDVWYRYPSPKEANPRPALQAFEKLDNVLMSPHCSSWTTEQDDRRILTVAENLTRLQRGEPLCDEVFVGLDA